MSLIEHRSAKFVEVDTENRILKVELSWTADGTRIGNSRSLVLAGKIRRKLFKTLSHNASPHVMFCFFKDSTT